MKQGNNSRRSRGRGNGKRPQRNNNVDSHGPEVRVRGTVQQVHDKYLTLARDATSSGDRIGAENYYQHAEHYYRIIAVQQENAELRQESRDGGRDNMRNRRGRNGAGDARNDAEGTGIGDQNVQANVAPGSSGQPSEQEADVTIAGTAHVGAAKQEGSEEEAKVERVMPDTDGDTDQPLDQSTV